MKRDPHAEAVNAELAGLHQAARFELAKCRKKYRDLFTKYHEQRRELENLRAVLRVASAPTSVKTGTDGGEA